MKKTHARGLDSADKHVLLAAACFNLKKWLRYGLPKPIRKPASAAKGPKKGKTMGYLQHMLPYFFPTAYSPPFFAVGKI